MSTKGSMKLEDTAVGIPPPLALAEEAEGWEIFPSSSLKYVCPGVAAYHRLMHWQGHSPHLLGNNLLEAGPQMPTRAAAVRSGRPPLFLK